MDDALASKVIQSVDNVSGQELGHFQAQRTMFRQKTSKIAVYGIVEENVVVLFLALVGPSSIHLEDVFVAQVPHDTHFVFHLSLDEGFLKGEVNILLLLE